MTESRIDFELSSARTQLPPPDGKPLIVHVVLNVEYWPFDRPVPRALLTTPNARTVIPDIPNHCWVEYGLRCGMPRLFKLLAGLPASVNLNAAVIDMYPALAVALRDTGWELVAHGMTQRILHDEEDEAGLIRQVVDKIEAFSGVRPRGWMGPGFAQTFDTPDHLTAAGIEYNLDWVLDDLPVWMRTKNGPLVALPYALELNDSLVYTVERHSSRELWLRFADTLETFAPELADQPRVLTLGLHPHQIGVPHRIGYLAKIIETLRARSDVIFMTGSGIADWFKDVSPLASEQTDA